MDYTDPSKNIQSTFKEHGRRGKNRKQMKFQRHSGNLHERMIQIKCKKKPSSKENFHSKKGCVGGCVCICNTHVIQKAFKDNNNFLKFLFEHRSGLK